MRASVFIDGFNYYHRIQEHFEKSNRNPSENLKWLDYQKLVKRIVIDDPNLVKLGLGHISVTFFTATPIHKPTATQERHRLYIQALQSQGVQICEGRFSRKKIEEKETDVALALAMYRAASKSLCDCVFLFSADTDFVPAFRALKEDFPNITRVLCTPPKANKYDALKPLATVRVGVGIEQMRLSQLPPRIETAKGIIENPYQPLLV